MSSWDEQRDIEAEGQRAAIFHSKRRQRDLARQAEAAGFVQPGTVNTSNAVELARETTRSEFFTSVLDLLYQMKGVDIPQEEIRIGHQAYTVLKIALMKFGWRECTDGRPSPTFLDIPIRACATVPQDEAQFVSAGQIRATLKLRPAK